MSSSTSKSAPSSPVVSSRQLTQRLKSEREKAKLNLESSTIWVEWKAANERMQSLQGHSQSPPSTSTPLTLPLATSSPPSSRSSILSIPGGVDGSFVSSPPSLSPSSSPASSVSSLSSPSYLLTPEVLLSLHDGFDLLDGSDPVFVEQARVHALLAAQQKVVALKGQLMESEEWKALVRANEELRMHAKKETEGIRASLGGGWTANQLLTLTATPSPPLTAAEAAQSLPALMLMEDTAQPMGDVAHEGGNGSSSSTSTPTLNRRSFTKMVQEEPFTPPSSVSSSTQPSPSSAAAAAVRPLPFLSHPLPVHSLPGVRSSPSTALPSSLHILPFHTLPTPVLSLIPTTASVAPLHPSQPHKAPSLMAHPPPSHPSPSALSSVPSSPVLSSLPSHPSSLPLVPRVSAFSSVRSKSSDVLPSPLHPQLPSTSSPHLVVGVQAARVVAAHSSTSGRHAAGDPSRLRSPNWCSGLIEDPHQVVPPGGLGLTSPDVHLSLCGSEKHQLQRLWSRMDGRSVLSALLRAIQFDVERNYEHPTPTAVEHLRDHLRLTVEGWTDGEFTATLPRHLRSTWTRAEYLAKQLSPHADPIDPAVLWVWRAATPKAPRIYLIQVTPPVKAGTAAQGRTGEGGVQAQGPSQAGLHSLRLQIIGDGAGGPSSSPHPNTPCVLLYGNYCSSIPHYEAMAWKKGTRGPSRLKTVISYQEPIISAIEGWQRQRQQQRVVARKRRRGEMVGEGGRALVTAVQATPAHPPPVAMAFDGA